MKISVFASALTLAGGLSVLASGATSETVTTAGVVCWTGDIEFLSTTEQDMAWVWTVDWTYTPDDRDMQKASTGRCLGSGGMIGGAVDVSNEYCVHNRQGGATYMSQGKSSPQGSKSIMFGGTGIMAGVVGGWTGSERIKLPAADGKLAGCRATSGEYTTM